MSDAALTESLLKDAAANGGLQHASTYPLLDAIVNRRARRFPVGATLPGEFNGWASKADPQPLSDVEEALVVMAGTALTGQALAELPYSNDDGSTLSGNTMLTFAGRAYSSACAAHGTHVFVTNDRETYYVDLDAVAKAGDLGTKSPTELLLAQWTIAKRVVQEGRLDIPKITPLVSPLNQWNMNVEGTTLVMPVTDVTVEYINLVITFLDQPRGVYLYDDVAGKEPLREFVGEGRLDRAKPFALSDFERAAAIYTQGSEQALMAQNIFLTLQAVGLGGWLLGAANGRMVMGATDLTPGLGFRCVDVPGTVLPDDAGSVTAQPARVPVGLDGMVEALVPPYVGNMREAVERLNARKWGKEGIFRNDKNPYGKRPDETGVPETPDWVIEAASTWVQHIYDTHGRFPATMDPLQMGIFVQAHHLDVEYYDRNFGPGAYPATVAHHQHLWHE
jgi:hypothetical protein